MRGSERPEHGLATAMRLLAEHLGVARCAYADVDLDGDRFVIPHDYAQAGASIAGEHRLSTFGERLAALIRDGQAPVVIGDAATELGADEASRLAALGIRAFVCCSLIRNGRLRALMAVHHANPRVWEQGEVAFVAEVVERCLHAPRAAMRPWGELNRRSSEAGN